MRRRFYDYANPKTRLRGSLRPLLEFESGSNDPMAVLLSLGALAFCKIRLLTPPLCSKCSVCSWLSAWRSVLFWENWPWCCCKSVYLLFRIIYSVRGGFGAAAFWVGPVVGRQRFLAVYVSGIVVGNSPFIYRRNLIRFHDSLSWIMQVGMFLLLGLLVNPHELLSVMPAGLAAAFFLIFTARPAAVFICLYRSGFGFREKLFISWAGLKGAVPIILATYPLMIGFPILGSCLT